MKLKLVGGSMNLIVFLNKTLVVVVLLLIAGCDSGGGKGEYVYRAPLLKECVSFAEDKLGELFSQLDFGYEIVKFDKSLDFQAEIFGYFLLYSDHLNVEALQRNANSVFLNCYPNSKEVVTKGPDFGERLEEALNLYGNSYYGEVYLADFDNRVEIHFKLKNLN